MTNEDPKRVRSHSEHSKPKEGGSPDSPTPHPGNDDADWKNLGPELCKATKQAIQNRLDAAGMKPLAVRDQENPKRDLIHMDINVDNCIEDKARYFEDVWKLLTQNFDVISCSEMSHKGLAFLADLTGFTPIKGEMETEFQQSNCALVNPKRIKVSQTLDIWQTAFDPKRDDFTQPNLDAGIAGSKNMRNAVMALLQDDIAETLERLLMLHLHSMKYPFAAEKENDPADTDYFREAQLRALTRVLKPLIPAMVQNKESLLCVGDYNLIFGSNAEKAFASLTALGLTVQGGKDEERWTQRMGQRIDAILALLANGIVIPQESFDVWLMTTNTLDHFARSFDRKTFMQKIHDLLGDAKNMNASLAGGPDKLALLQKMMLELVALGNATDLMPHIDAKDEPHAGSPPIFTDHNALIFQVTRMPAAGPAGRLIR